MNALITKSLLEIVPSLSPVRFLLSSTRPGLTFKPQNFVSKVVAGAVSYFWPPSKKSHHAFLRSLTDTGRPLDELLGNILGLAVGASVTHAQAAAQVIDFYLDDAREKERQHISQLVNSRDAQSADLLRGYVNEAMRKHTYNIPRMRPN